MNKNTSIGQSSMVLDGIHMNLFSGPEVIHMLCEI